MVNEIYIMIKQGCLSVNASMAEIRPDGYAHTIDTSYLSYIYGINCNLDQI